MKTTLRVACGAALLGGLLLAANGCEKSYEERRPGVSDLDPGNGGGLQSKDLVEMTDKMAPDLLQIPEIVQNRTKITVVMTGIDNKTSAPYVDQTIYVARLRTLLNKYGRDRVAFVEKRATLEKLQAQEGQVVVDPFEEATRTNQPAPPSRIVPQYALKGEFYDLPRNGTNYYLCTFQLTSIRTGELIWEGRYEVKTLGL